MFESHLLVFQEKSVLFEVEEIFQNVQDLFRSSRSVLRGFPRKKTTCREERESKFMANIAF